MATTKAPANFNVLDKDKNLNKDYRRLTKGMKILRGNRWASFFGASNYQKLNRSYRSQFVQKRPDGKGGVILFDTRTQQPTNDKLINEAIVKNVTGSSNPTADLKYITARGKAEIQKNLGNLKDGVSLNDIFFHTKRLFSDPVYNTKGEKTGKEIDLKRNVEADRLRIQASEASLGTSYDEFLDPASPVYRSGGTEIKQGTTVGNTFVRTDGSIDNSTIPPTETGQKPVTVTNKEKTVDTNEAIKSVEKNSAFSNRASGDSGSTTQESMKITGSLERWSRGGGRTLDQADAQTEQWLTDKGYDVSKISKHDKRAVYRDLRARGPHIVNGNIRLDGGRGNQRKYNLKINKPDTVES